MLNVLTDGINYILSLGTSVMMPIIFFIFAICLQVRFGKAIKAGLMVGVGFIGLNVITNLLTTSLAPAAKGMINNFGLHLNVIDVGWPAASAIAFGSIVGALIIPMGLLLNVVMLFTKTTQTINVDIWNYWHFAFTGSLVAILTKSIPMGLFAAAVNMIIIMIIADMTAKGVERELHLPGISIPHGFSASFVPIAVVINKLIDKIPKVRDIQLDSETLQNKIGVFGEPVFLGTVIGALIGIVAGFDVKGVTNLAVTMGAVLVLIPKMAAVLMEGLMPVSEAAQNLVTSKFKNSGKIYIGLDSAVSIGHPTTLVVSLLMIPITLFLAVIIPGNNFLPFASLSGLPFMFVMIVAVTRGNLFRTLICGVFFSTFGILFATVLAPLFTMAAKVVNFAMPAGANTVVSSLDYAGSPLAWVLVELMNYKIIGVLIILIPTLLFMLYNRKRILKEAKLIHESVNEKAQL
ncbi:PTS galactitol transporter subunit IIC [Sporolactobacillus terrae]|uniref:PTS galactitol transporter subunit IIC n=1 Tax=Sporolactobacillus terrae TaxID=269673 RepID=UPI001118A7D2|nr:PTS transporter subunit IIC [Sporolactobacillus terrae]